MFIKLNAKTYSVTFVDELADHGRPTSDVPRTEDYSGVSKLGLSLREKLFTRCTIHESRFYCLVHTHDLHAVLNSLRSSVPSLSSSPM